MTFESLWFQVAPNKLEGLTTSLIFLEFEVNSNFMEMHCRYPRWGTKKDGATMARMQVEYAQGAGVSGWKAGTVQSC